MITKPRYVIAVHDLARSAAFYRDVLGFEVHPLGHDPGWRVFRRDECIIMAGACPDAPSARDIGDHSYFAYLQVEPIDSFYEGVLGRGAEVIKPLCDEPWGMREFGIVTVDGHRMMFGSPIPREMMRR
ncbi:MAG: hypothetical protein JWN53_56 [Gemmatimonadetes bacterium]|jgi:uncharacterized glyoxalase superfamily protein PhnB|nr:hypothetical protein [Gemmatimonadota bacterium]